MRRGARRGHWPLLALLLFVGGSAGAAPIATQLDWDVQLWPPGTLTQAYPIGSGTVTFTWTGATGSLIQNRPLVGQSETGGLTPAENSLSVRVNYPASPSQITATIDFSHPGE